MGQDLCSNVCCHTEYPNPSDRYGPDALEMGTEQR